MAFGSSGRAECHMIFEVMLISQKKNGNKCWTVRISFISLQR